MPVTLSDYLKVLKAIRRERGEKCEACGIPAKHGHHIIPVSVTGISSPLFVEPSNIMILCDDCHLLMHPLIRNTEWSTVRKGRGLAIRRN
ncbi:MAG: HNH endonuclease [Desulfobacteraceae bacterium]|nr:HNH endonuclease [Desulfobacteraceae bacterium]